MLFRSRKSSANSKTAIVDGTNVKAITNIDGNFQIDGLDKEKKYTLYINYVGYKTQKIDGVQAKDADQVIALQPDEQQLKEVTITAVERRNTDAAMIQVAKSSPVIVSNVSAQEISRTQDTNAGEVIRRVPGVSLIDNALESGVYALSTGNDISREWTQLDEHILSLGVNDKHYFKFGNFEPDLLVGAYGGVSQPRIPDPQLHQLSSLRLDLIGWCRRLYSYRRKPIARCRKFRRLDRFRHSNLHRSLRWQQQLDERLDQLRSSECEVLKKNS